MASFVKDNLNSKTVMAAIIGAIAVVTVAVISALGSCSSIAKDNERLKERLNSCENDLSSARTQVSELQNELIPFKTVAYQRYGSMDTDSMRKLADALLSVQKDLEEINAKTSQIKLLPDGSVKIGGAVFGEPEKLKETFTNACNAYNIQRFEGAYVYATNYLAIYEESKPQDKDACFRLTRFNIPINTALMLSIVAEGSMSKGNYALALKQIESAIALHREPYFDAIKTVLLMHLDQFKPVNEMLLFYKAQPDEDRRVYYGSLLKWGYLSKYNFPEGYAAIKKEFKLTFEIETPMAFCTSAKMKDGKTHEAYAYMLWTGLGTFKPMNYDYKILDK